MKFYLVAEIRGMLINPVTFAPKWNIKYVIELRDVCNGSITLDRWISMIYLGGALGTIRKQDKIVITPIDEIVPWLVRGLKNAVLHNATDDILPIIELVHIAGMNNSELEVIQKSLCSL